MTRSSPMLIRRPNEPDKLDAMDHDPATPKLKRYATWNSSVRGSSPSLSICSPSQTPAPSMERRHAKSSMQLLSEGECDFGYPSTSNWILREKGPSMGATGLTCGNITVVSPTAEKSSTLRKSFSHLKHGLNGEIMREQILTHGRLHLVKANSLGKHRNLALDATNIAVEKENYYHFAHNFQHNSAKSRKTIFDIFDRCCCYCAGSNLATHKFLAHPNSQQAYAIRRSSGHNNLGGSLTSASSCLSGDNPISRSNSGDSGQPSTIPDRQSSPVPEIQLMGPESPESSCPEIIEENDSGFGTPLVVTRNDSMTQNRDVSPRTPLSSDFSDESSLISFNSSRLSCSSIYRSCPDLLQPCLEKDTAHMKQPSNFQASKCNTLGEFRRAKLHKRRSGWHTKPMRLWHLDDILTWLQHLGLDDVAAVVVGYDLTGAEFVQWNKSTLDLLQISEQSQAILLRELKGLRDQHTTNRTKKSSTSRCSLYPLLEDSTGRNDSSQQCLSLPAKEIQAISLPRGSTCQSFSVAENHNGALIVTKINDRSLSLLQQGDCIIEVNGICCLHMPAVDFNQQVSDSEHVHKLVILRNGGSRQSKPRHNSVQNFSDQPDITSEGPGLQKPNSTPSFMSLCSSVERSDNFQIMHF